MGVLTSLHTGVSGLSAQGEALGVIGDNIANANTTGFKASRAEFQDIIAKNLKGNLMLVTGDVDNNVHPGGTIRMANALIEKLVNKLKRLYQSTRSDIREI